MDFDVCTGLIFNELTETAAHMSAGTGIFHSKMNNNADKCVEFIQICIYQNAWFHLGELDKNHIEKYELKNSGDGLYIL